jgi:hypothetical protein
MYRAGCGLVVRGIVIRLPAGQELSHFQDAEKGVRPPFRLLSKFIFLSFPGDKADRS